MTYVAERIPLSPRIVLVDSTSRFTQSSARALADLGVAGIVRTVETMSPEELEWLTGAGLGVMWYQYARIEGVNGQSGDTDGARARREARAVGFLDDVTGWCDRESTSIVPGAADEKLYQDAWWAACGGDPGVYRGAGIALDGAGWWSVKFRRYWRSFSQVPNVAHRDDQLVQLWPGDVRLAPDIPPVDIDVAKSDYFGDRPVWQKQA